MEEERKFHFDKLYHFHKETGFQLLLNESAILDREGEQLPIIGVENWGLPPFPQEGDIDKAAAGTEKFPFSMSDGSFPV